MGIGFCLMTAFDTLIKEFLEDKKQAMQINDLQGLFLVGRRELKLQVCRFFLL